MNTIQLLREYIAEPTTRFWDDPFLEQILGSKGGDLFGAAAEIWRLKTGKMAEHFDFMVDRADSFEKSAVFRHCKAMAEYYDSMAGSQIVNVKMATDDTVGEDTDAEFAD